MDLACASPTNVDVDRTWMPKAAMLWSVKRHLVTGKIARHQVLNDIIWHAFNAADVPAIKEPSGLNRQDGKRPDGLTLIPSYHIISLISYHSVGLHF